ncbi:site-specific DNA-methyltransferase [Treponema primitia]|uniref:site-specific DNA-methyltransferase n=1 Tax=Treponema primitia TaxID=88058 RepID=UPI0039814A87
MGGFPFKKNLGAKIMPTLQFKGKNIIWNHHLSVPYHTLDEVEKLHYHPETPAGNLIIEGDNLLALKALLPQYTGKIKCIYIDPPYNTGTENWVYNDNVNNPMIKDWLGKVVGKDDLARHDKWLYMMAPRLKLMRDLLSSTGSIFISIDDNEIYTLIQLMTETFGQDNFKNIIIIRRGIKSVQAQFETVDRLNYGCEYVIVFSREGDYKYKKFEVELENGKEGGWNNHWRGTDRPTMRYSLFGIIPETGQWRWSESRSIVAVENYKSMLKELGKTEENVTQEEIDVWYKKYLDENGEDIDLLRLSSNEKPEHYIPPSESKLASTHWNDIKPNGSSQLKALFGKKVFDNPKSIDLIKRLIQFSTDNSENAIVLDAFAGSGTTMHACMELNNDDTGNRHCILIQSPEISKDDPKKNICKDITRERIKRAIDKYSYKSGFRYFKVGIPIDAETILSGQLPTYKQFAEYVYYLCTGNSLSDKKTIDEKSYYVGSYNRNVIYLLYKQNFDALTKMPLNFDLAEQLIKTNPDKRIIVYAPACFLDDDYMKDNNIDFVGIPYNLFSRVNP